jgi:signal transduction histidine kinase
VLTIMNIVKADFFKHAPIGICAIDTQEQFYFANPYAQHLWQKSQSEIIGQHLETLAETAGEQFCQRCRSVIETRVGIEFKDYSSVLERWFYYYLCPANHHLTIYFQDISEWQSIKIEHQQHLEQLQEARRFLNEVGQKRAFFAELSRISATSLDYRTTPDTIVETIVSHVADCCVLQKIEDGSVTTTVAAHREPQKQKLANALAQQYPRIAQKPDSLTWQAIHSHQPILVENMTELVDSSIEDPTILELCQFLQSSSAIMLPLIARGNVVGTMLFVSQQPDRHYSQSEIDFVSGVAHWAAMVLDNAQLHQKVQEFSRHKTEFLSTLSHELRTPLHLIQGWAQIMNTSSTEENLLRSGIDVIQRKAKELQTIVYDLLDASQIVQGQFHLNPTAIDLDALIQEVIHSFQVAIAAKSIQLQVLKYPSESTQFRVWGDCERLRQALWHLLSNAIKFTPPQGQILIELSITANAVCELKIVDTGKGIKQEFLPHVFEQFRQADGTTTRHYEGLGLGLSLVKYLVELHGGTIEIMSAGEGQGTTAKLELVELPNANETANLHSCH